MHKLIEPKPPPPLHLGNTTIVIEPESPDHKLHTIAVANIDKKTNGLTIQNIMTSPLSLVYVSITKPSITKLNTYHLYTRYIQMIPSTSVLYRFNVELQQHLNSPFPTCIYIPIPKRHQLHHHRNILHDVTWETYDRNNWNRNDKGG